MKPNLLVLATLFVSAPLHAALISGVTLHDSDGTTPNTQMTPSDVIDGSGLASEAFGATHSTTWSDHWYSSLSTGAYLTVDLGDTFVVDTIHIWNENEDNAGRLRGMKNATIYVSPDDNVANLVALATDGSGTHDNGSGAFLFPQGLGAASYTGFSLDLSGVTNSALLSSVRLIRIQNIDNYGSSGGSGLAEARFGGTLVPEPGSTLLAGLGGLLLLWRRPVRKSA